MVDAVGDTINAHSTAAKLRFNGIVGKCGADLSAVPVISTP